MERLASAFYSPARKGAMKNVPSIIRQVELARVFWRYLGISWTDLQEMDATEVRLIDTILAIAAEVKGGLGGGGCPFA